MEPPARGGARAVRVPKAGLEPEVGFGKRRGGVSGSPCLSEQQRARSRGAASAAAGLIPAS